VNAHQQCRTAHRGRHLSQRSDQDVPNGPKLSTRNRHVQVTPARLPQLYEGSGPSGSRSHKPAPIPKSVKRCAASNTWYIVLKSARTMPTHTRTDRLWTQWGQSGSSRSSPWHQADLPMGGTTKLTLLPAGQDPDALSLTATRSAPRRPLISATAHWHERSFSHFRILARLSGK